MLNIDRALGDDRLIKAMTGLSASGFNELTKSFGEEFQNEAQVRYETGVELGNRERKPGGGRIGNLESYATEIFFTLFYFKCYTTFEILGFLFDLNRSNPNRNIHKLTSILEKALGRWMVLPERRISTVEELLEVFHDVRRGYINRWHRETDPETKRQRETERKLLRQEEDAYSEEYNHLRQEEANWICKPNCEWKET